MLCNCKSAGTKWPPKMQRGAALGQTGTPTHTHTHTQSTCSNWLAIDRSFGDFTKQLARKDTKCTDLQERRQCNETFPGFELTHRDALFKVCDAKKHKN